MNGVVCAGCLIVFCKFCTQSTNLNPDPGVSLGIEIRRATEDLSSNFVLLQMAFRRVQRVLGEELKKLAKSLASREMRTPYQPVDLRQVTLRIDCIGVFTSFLIAI